MNSSRIAAKTRDQLGRFPGNVFPHFTKPARKFLWQMLFGIQASGDVKLSSVVQMLDEDVMGYTSLRNMAAVVLATAYFATACLGRRIRMEVLVEHLEHLGKRLKEVPEMFFYALADGIRRAFARHGAGRTCPPYPAERFTALFSSACDDSRLRSAEDFGACRTALKMKCGIFTLKRTGHPPVF